MFKASQWKSQEFTDGPEKASISKLVEKDRVRLTKVPDDRHGEPPANRKERRAAVKIKKPARTDKLDEHLN